MSRNNRERVFDPALKRLSSAIVFGSMMSILDTTIVNVAVPTLGREFHATLASVQWVSSGYALALATVIPLTRWVIDRFGTRRAWLACLTLFLLGSALSGAAWSLPTLIACRILQGLGGGMVLPIGQTILSREAGPARMGRVMTVVGIPSMIGPLIGPALGGLILVKLSWHWIFYVNIPIGAIALVLGVRFLPHDGRQPSGPFDFKGFLLLPTGLGLSVYGLAAVGNDGRLTRTVAITVALGIGLIVTFIVHALRTEHPLLDIRLWKVRGFATSNLASFFITMGILGTTLTLTLYFQLDRGFSPVIAGLLQSPTSLVAMIFLPLAGSITDRFGARRIAPVGILASAIALFCWGFVGRVSSLFFLEAALVVRGVGLGSSNTPITASGYSQLTSEQLSSASTLTNIVGRLGGAIGVATMSVVLQRRLAAELPGHALRLGSLARSAATHRDAALGIGNAFGQTFFVATAICLAAIVPAAFLRSRPAG